MDNEMSVNDERIFDNIDEDALDAELNLNDLPDQSTLKLLVTRLKLSVIELKVSQKLQNNNLLIHIDQLKKKYAALKGEVDSIKSEKQVKMCNVYQQTDGCNSNSPIIGNKATSLVNYSNKCVQTENPIIQNNDSMVQIQKEIQGNVNLSQTASTIENISSNIDLSHLVKEDESINTAMNLSSLDKVDKDVGCNLNANFSVEHNQVEEQLTNSTCEPAKPNKIDSNISSAISKYLAQVTGLKISIISCNTMNQNEWVVLNSESDRSIKTVIICVTFYSEECFSVATSKNTHKIESDHEKYFQVVYKITQQGNVPLESTSCDMNIDDLDTSPALLSSSVEKNCFDTTSQPNDVNPSLNNQINQKKASSNLVKNGSTSNLASFENNNVESLMSNRITDNRKSNIVSDSPSHTSSPLLLPKETPFSASNPNKFGHGKNNEKSLNIITMQDTRKQNSRNRNHSRVLIKNNPNYNHRNKYRKSATRRMFESLMDSCETNSKLGPAEPTFVRTEKKRLSNVPSITIREHVLLDQQEEEQILSSENDDVFIIEQENHPIEID